MRQSVSVLFLMLITIGFFPWYMVCASHPLGHVHHHAPGDLSPCQERKLCNECSVWPPMNCERLPVFLEDYQPPNQENLVPFALTLAPVFPVEINVTFPNKGDHIPMPEVRGNSDPPPNNTSLRAPPII